MAKGDVYACDRCSRAEIATFEGSTPYCGHCESDRVHLYMRAPNRSERAILKAKSVEDVDPDWREHFQDEDRAREFYGLQAEGSVGK